MKEKVTDEQVKSAREIAGFDKEGFSLVSHPTHYQSMNASLNIECIDAMRAAYGDDVVKDFCICNAFKYLFRHTSKGGNTDILKAKWYLDKYIELGGCNQ